MDLAAIPWRTTRYAGIDVHFYATDAKTGRVTALIRMAPGCGYPTHKHRGPEDVLVLQGAYYDEFGTHEAGSFTSYEAKSEHAPVARTGGEACVLLAVAHEGVILVHGATGRTDQPLA